MSGFGLPCFLGCLFGEAEGEGGGMLLLAGNAFCVVIVAMGEWAGHGDMGWDQ